MSAHRSVEWQGVTYTESEIGTEAYEAILTAKALLDNTSANDQKRYEIHEALAIMIAVYGEAFTISYVNGLLP